MIFIDKNIDNFVGLFYEKSDDIFLKISFTKNYLYTYIYDWLVLHWKTAKVAWPSGLRRRFKAPVSSEAWVRIPPLPIVFQILTFTFDLMIYAVYWLFPLKIKRVTFSVKTYFFNYNVNAASVKHSYSELKFECQSSSYIRKIQRPKLFLIELNKAQVMVIFTFWTQKFHI